MDTRILLILSCSFLATSAWSRPFYPVPRGPMRFTRFAPPPPAYLRPHPQHHSHAQLHSQPHTQPYAQLQAQPHSQLQVQPHLKLHVQPHSQSQVHPHSQPHHKTPVESADLEEKQWQRPKRGHDDYDHDHDHDHDHKSTSGVTGPVHTFVKTDKNANYKWGVRHHVGDKYAS